MNTFITTLCVCVCVCVSMRMCECVFVSVQLVGRKIYCATTSAPMKHPFDPGADTHLPPPLFQC